VHASANLGVEAQTHREICNSEAASNARICHTSHVEPCESSLVGGHIGLLMALSIHSFLEGLAIGVQDTGKKVNTIFFLLTSLN
jgi:zinc transporter ZupT